MTPQILEAIVAGADSVLSALAALILLGVALVCGAWCYVAGRQRGYTVLCRRFTAIDGSVVSVRLSGRASLAELQHELDVVAAVLRLVPLESRTINEPR